VVVVAVLPERITDKDLREHARVIQLVKTCEMSLTKLEEDPETAVRNAG